MTKLNKKTNTKFRVKFYADGQYKGKSYSNYQFTYNVDDERQAHRMLDKFRRNGFRIRAAWVEKIDQYGTANTRIV